MLLWMNLSTLAFYAKLQKDITNSRSIIAFQEKKDVSNSQLRMQFTFSRKTGILSLTDVTCYEQAESQILQKLLLHHCSRSSFYVLLRSRRRTLRGNLWYSHCGYYHWHCSIHGFLGCLRKVWHTQESLRFGIIITQEYSLQMLLGIFFPFTNNRAYKVEDRI